MRCRFLYVCQRGSALTQTHMDTADVHKHIRARVNVKRWRWARQLIPLIWQFWLDLGQSTSAASIGRIPLKYHHIQIKVRVSSMNWLIITADINLRPWHVLRQVTNRCLNIQLEVDTGSPWRHFDSPVLLHNRSDHTYNNMIGVKGHLIVDSFLSWRLDGLSSLSEEC